VNKAISFIVIGRNEGWRLVKCLESISFAIKKNKITNYEIIYVDSNSTDGSIERALSFKEVRVFSITGVFNAAIARNIGVKESSGNILFFIDGDMEIQADFLPVVYNPLNGDLKYDFVSGQWINYYYNAQGILFKKENYNINDVRDIISARTGGLFLIRKKIWEENGGMKTKMRRSQDLDFALRLSKRGIFLMRKKELLAIHHTVSYIDKKRIWNLLFTGAHLFRIVLLRENFFNKYEWSLFLRGNYTFFILLFSFILSYCNHNIGYLSMYGISIILRTYVRGDKTIRSFLTNLLYFPLYELSMFFGFFLFWPKSHKESYISIKI